MGAAAAVPAAISIGGALMSGLSKPKTGAIPTTSPLGSLPSWAQQAAQRMTTGFEKQAGVIDPSAAFKGAQSQIMGTLAGDYFDMAKNPALKQYVDYLQSEAGRRGDVERAAMRERFGRLGPAFSMDEAKASADLERDLSQRTTGQIAQFLNPIYQSERARQYEAAGGASQLGMMPSQGMQNILRTLSGSAGGQQPYVGQSKMGQMGQALSGMGGALGGIMGK